MLYLCTLMRFAEKCAKAFVFVAAVVLARTFEKQVRVQTRGRVSGLC